MYWLFEVRDTDGNDCSVFDVIVEAETLEKASSLLWAKLSASYPKDESDGGFGTFHACDCACDHADAENPGICEACADSWDCYHGGLVTNEDSPAPYGPRSFETYQEARDAGSIFHEKLDIPTEKEWVLE